MCSNLCTYVLFYAICSINSVSGVFILKIACKMKKHSSYTQMVHLMNQKMYLMYSTFTQLSKIHTLDGMNIVHSKIA